MLIFSMLLFSRLVQRMTDLQITSVLQLIGDKGRKVIRDTFRHLDKRPVAECEMNPLVGFSLARSLKLLCIRGIHERSRSSIPMACSGRHSGAVA